MAATASDWTLYIESDTGATCKMVAIDCADLGDLSDNVGGALQSLGARATHTNKVLETRRFRNYEPSSAVLVVPEDGADFIEELRRLDCVTAIQRRLCADSGDCCAWGTVEHFSDVQIGAIQKTSLTASGLNVTDGVPMVAASIIYGRRSILRNKDIRYIDAGGSGSALSDSIIDMTYCDCESCSSGVGSNCQTIFRLTSGGSIEASYDSGETWTPLAVCLPGAAPSAIYCVNGRLLASVGNGKAFYADDPEGEWTQSVGLSGTITRFTSNGTVIYGLTVSANGRYGVAISIDSGRSWSTSLEGIANEIFDIASAGQYAVATSKSGKLYVSTSKGVSWSVVSPSLPGVSAPDIVAAAIDTRNGRTVSDVVIVLADHNNNIYKGNLDGWTRIYSGASHGATSTVGSQAYLRTFLNGNIIWWAREVGGKAVVMKNAGDCTCWERWENAVTEGLCNDDSIPPDTYVLGCIVDGVVQSIMRCEAQEIPCDDDLNYIYGCTVGDETYVLRCDDNGCEETYVSPVNDCATCTCPDCGSECGTCACDACDGCQDCGVAAQQVDEVALQELIDQLNCCADCECITLDDFNYQIECGETALVGPGCIDVDTVDVYEVGCGISMVFAVCPHDMDTAIAIGTESLQG